MNNNTVVAVVVTYNGKKWLGKCIGSLAKSILPVHIIVVDNGSSDGSVEYLHTNFPSIEIIETGHNLGFGQANNIGFRRALELDADFVFLLNQDAWIYDNTIQQLVEIASNDNQWGILSPIHLNASGSDFDYKFKEYIQPPYCSDFVSDNYFQRLKSVYQTSFVNAAAWLIPRHVIKRVGGFDPLFPHYGEDVDYIQRCINKKLFIGICTNVKVHHDSKVQLWSDIMWNEKRMITIYLSEIKDINSSFRSNLLIFLKRRWDELTSNLIYRQIKLFLFRFKLIFKIVFQLRKVTRARKLSQKEGAFL
jgi:GT2 family glycosyltransferase